jgi:hypothetical protein
MTQTPALPAGPSKGGEAPVDASDPAAGHGSGDRPFVGRRRKKEWREINIIFNC